MSLEMLPTESEVRVWNNFHVRSDGHIVGPSGRVVHGSRQSKGYLQTTTKNKQKILLHHIVAAAYHGFQSDGTTEIDHIDGNKKNNHPCNLRVVSKEEHRSFDAKRRLDVSLWDQCHS